MFDGHGVFSNSLSYAINFVFMILSVEQRWVILVKGTHYCGNYAHKIFGLENHLPFCLKTSCCSTQCRIWHLVDCPLMLQAFAPNYWVLGTIFDETHLGTIDSKSFWNTSNICCRFRSYRMCCWCSVVNLCKLFELRGCGTKHCVN